MIGSRYGRLTIIQRAPSRPPSRATRWLCRCDCGTEKVIEARNFRGGYTQSCGCLQKDVQAKRMTRHGDSPHRGYSREYAAWMNMKARCYNPDTPGYHRYGGRGIAVCGEWRNDFAAFLRDVGRRPSSAHSLDRVNGDGNYEPSNCRWATPGQQLNNTSRNRRLTLGAETMSVAQWSRHLNLSTRTISDRLRKGWPTERVLAIHSRRS
jgi:hypothetical protein